jgi:glycosyltransferase involved in cell wall biosynthesis
MGLAANSPRMLARRPGRIIDAERRLRELTRSRPEVLLMSREATPFGRGRVEIEILRSAEHSVLDFDDAVMFDNRPWTDPKAWLSATSKYRNLASTADVVIAGSEVIMDWASNMAEVAVLIPSCVEPDDYAVADLRELHDPPRAVWIGTPSTEKYLQDIELELLRVHMQTGLRLTVISAGNRQLGELDRMVDRVVWSRDSFASHLANADFGIAPLRDDLMSRGKCAYKLLQYGAAGLPVVASPVGANDTVIELTGGIPVPHSDWLDALRSAAGLSDQERVRMGKRARTAIEDHYSYAAWADVWQEVVLGGRVPVEESSSRPQRRLKRL